MSFAEYLTDEKFFLREKYHCIIIPLYFLRYTLIIIEFAIMMLSIYLSKSIINVSRFRTKVSSFWHMRQISTHFFAIGFAFSYSFLLTSNVALTTLSLRIFSPSVIVAIGEFTRVPDLRAMSAQAMGIGCPSSGLHSNARMRADLQRYER